MEVATAAITLATCLKDIIRLVQELKRTIDKIPKNRRNARKLSDELLEGILEIEAFYKAREGLLEGNPELGAAMTNLLSKTMSVQQRCVQLYTPLNHKGLRKIGATVKAWRECDQVEEEIAELKDLVQRCFRRFSMMAIARLEQPVTHIAFTTTRIERRMVHLQTMLGRVEGGLTTLQGSGLAVSNSMSIHPSINAVSKLYLHQQIETICDLLRELSITETFAREQPEGCYLLPPSFVVSTFTISPLVHDTHRDVIALAIQIIGLLKGNPADISIQDGALVMLDLGIMLGALEMYSDAKAIGQWTVTMYRALVATHPAVYAPYLSLSLRNLSGVRDSGDAVIASLESLEIARGQVQVYSTLQTHLEVADSLIAYWSVLAGPVEKHLEVASEAVAICHSILAELASVGDSQSSCLHLADVILGNDQPWTDIARTNSSMWDEEDTLTLKYNYASALYALAWSLEMDNRTVQAYEIQLRSLAIFKDLSQTEEAFIDDLAASYAHLATPAMCEGHSNHESLAYAECAVELYRTCVETQPDTYTPSLLCALWDYAFLLHEAGRDTDVFHVSEEALELVRKSNQTAELLAQALYASSGKLQQIKQIDAAIILRTEAITLYQTLPSRGPEPVDSIADVLMCLANDLILAGKHDNAVAACKEAVDILQAKQEKDDSHTTSLKLAASLSFFCYITSTAEDYDAAVKIGTKAISIYRNMFQILGAEFKDIANYITAIQRAVSASSYAADTRALATTAAALEDLLMLRVDHREAVEIPLMGAFCDHNSLLTEHRRVRDSVQLSERILPLFTLPLTKAAVAAEYLGALYTYADNLYDVGRFKDAYLTLDKGIQLGSTFSGDNATKELALWLSFIHSLQALILNESGQCAKAESIMKLSIEASKEHLIPADVILLAYRYCRYASILQNLPGHLDEALKIGQEAVTLCHTFATSPPALSIQAGLAYAIRSYAQTVADSGDAHQALALVQESTDIY
ncbi:hypothetical protein DXG01_009092 [Tephrocybe rancida]|nr:hypothetical protein DXG01_009092 [Tephrocybe rancida]